MTLEQIVARIKARNQEGLALNISAVKRSEPELLAAAFAQRPFLGWRGALAKAGIEYGQIRVELLTAVRCEDCGEYFSNLGGHLRVHNGGSEDYLQDYPGAELSSEAFRALRFGWNRSGKPSKYLLTPHWEPLWSPEYVLDRLWWCHQEGHDLSFAALSRVEKSLGQEAWKMFEGYDNALKALGLDPANIRKIEPTEVWDAQRILEHLLDRIEAGKSLAPSSVMGRNSPNFLRACKRVFGSYQAALRKAGVADPSQVWKRQNIAVIRRQWASFLEQARQVAQEPWNPDAIQKFRDKWSTFMRKRNQSWEGVTKTLEMPVWTLNPNRAVYLTHRPDVILSIIQNRLAADKSVLSGVVFLEDRQLWDAAQHCFGGYQEALKAANVPPEAASPLKYPTRESVIAALQERQKRGWGLRQADVVPKDAPHKDLPLLGAIQRYFDDWTCALEAAGIVPSFHARNRGSKIKAITPPKVKAPKEPKRRAAAPKLPKPSVLDFPQSRLLPGGPWARIRLRQAPEEEAAPAGTGDMNCDHLRLGQPSEDGTTLSIEEIVAGIRYRHESGLPLNISAVKRSDPRLLAAAFAHNPFLGWRKALKLAGVDYDQLEIELTTFVRCSCCGQNAGHIRAHLKSVHNMTVEDYGRRHPGAELSSEAFRARRMGIPRKKPELPPIPHWEPLWTPEYVLDRLWRYHEEGYSIHFVEISRIERGLAVAAWDMFDSYDLVLRSLRLEPSHIRLSPPSRPWDKQRILAHLREAHASGRSLAPCLVHGRNSANFIRACKREFGSYEEALRQIGMDRRQIGRRATEEANKRSDAEFLRLAAKIVEGPWQEKPLAEFRKKWGRFAKNRFQGWFNVAKLLGVPEWRVTASRCNFLVHNPDEILRAIQERHRAGKGVRSSDVFREDRNLWSASEEKFGRYTDAAERAEVPHHAIFPHG